MEIPPSAYPAIGAIAAATIGGAISFVVTVLSKEQKTSEFRQAWIDALRDDLSEFISTIDALTSFLRIKDSRSATPDEVSAFLHEKYADLHRMGVSFHRIMLRLNPNEHTVLIERLEELLAVMSVHTQAVNEQHVTQLTKAVVVESQRVLKSEWTRVKRGELVFVVTKYASLAIFLVAAVFAIAIAWDHLVIQFHA
ncbi:MAG: hypothetical protein ACKOCD_03120 [Nitrospiraceae bacterium]